MWRGDGTGRTPGDVEDDADRARGMAAEMRDERARDEHAAAMFGQSEEDFQRAQDDEMRGQRERDDLMDTL